MYKTDVAIIGGGAAGLACAACLKKLNSNIDVTIIDAGERLGKKLAATGNGQGNVTNKNMSAEHYFGGNIKLTEKILSKSQGIEDELFHCVLSSDEKGRVYPTGRQASALVDSIMSDIKRLKINVKYGDRVINIDKNLILTLASGEKFCANQVVLAVGGKAQKQFKTDGTSYALAQNLGHTITKLYPSLVQIKTDTQYTKTLKGIRCDCVVSAIYKGKVIAQKRGDVIFTDYGVSGNAIFEISPYIVDKDGVTLRLRFLPFEKGQIKNDVLAKKQLGYQTSELLSGTLHNQLGRAIIKRCESDDPEVIENTVFNFTLPVIGNLGFDYAQVTKGGINLNEVTDELESKLIKNLFFAGEVLDVDGECGGYNLHWAFSSGSAVARSIAKRYD
jgi:hypothetical protein